MVKRKFNNDSSSLDSNMNFISHTLNKKQTPAFLLLLMHDQIHDFCENSDRNQFKNINLLCSIIVKKYISFFVKNLNYSKNYIFNTLKKPDSNNSLLLSALDTYFSIFSDSFKKSIPLIKELLLKNKLYAHVISESFSFSWSYSDHSKLTLDNPLPCFSNYQSLNHFFDNPNKIINLYIDADQKKFRLAPLFDYICNKESLKKSDLYTVKFVESPMNIYDQANDGFVKGFFSDLKDIYNSNLIDSSRVLPISDNVYHFTILSHDEKHVILEYRIRIKSKTSSSKSFNSITDYIKQVVWFSNYPFSWVPAVMCIKFFMSKLDPNFPS